MLRISLIAVALSFLPSSAWSQSAPSSADARLRALYTEEWNWRQQELGRGAASDRFPRVDAASQQARLTHWTRTLATLDTIPLDRRGTASRRRWRSKGRNGRPSVEARRSPDTAKAGDSTRNGWAP